MNLTEDQRRGIANVRGQSGPTTRWPDPMNPAARQGLIGDIVTRIEPHSEADPAALLISLLVGVGSMLGRDVGAHAGTGAFHGCNLFAAVVGKTGRARKGTSWTVAERVITWADPSYVNQIAGGLSTAEGLIYRVKDPIEKRRNPKNDREREEADADGLLTELVDEGVDDKRLLLHESEFASTLRRMSKSDSTLSPILRGLWESGNASTLTKQTPIHTTGAHISLLAHITEKELKRELTDTESASGFGNRFLWCCAKKARSLPEGGAMSEQDLKHELDALRTVMSFMKGGANMHRDKATIELWAAIYESLSDEDQEPAGLHGAVTSRGEAQVLRLSMIYAACDLSEVVHVEHMLAALAVWDYAYRSAAYIFSATPENPIAARILSAVTDAGQLDRTALMKDVFKGHKSSADIKEALDELIGRGAVVVRAQKTDGRSRNIIEATGATVEGAEGRPSWMALLPDAGVSSQSTAPFYADEAPSASVNGTPANGLFSPTDGDLSSLHTLTPPGAEL